MTDTQKKASISDRLNSHYETCKETFDAWESAKEDNDKKAALQKSLHELRRVLAAIEIEIAKNESKSRVQSHSSQENNYVSQPKKGSRRPQNRQQAKKGNDEENSLPGFLTQDQKKEKKPSSNPRTKKET